MSNIVVVVAGKVHDILVSAEGEVKAFVGSAEHWLATEWARVHGVEAVIGADSTVALADVKAVVAAVKADVKDAGTTVAAQPAKV